MYPPAIEALALAFALGPDPAPHHRYPRTPKLLAVKATSQQATSQQSSWSAAKKSTLTLCRRHLLALALRRVHCSLQSAEEKSKRVAYAYFA